MPPGSPAVSHQWANAHPKGVCLGISFPWEPPGMFTKFFLIPNFLQVSTDSPYHRIVILFSCKHLETDLTKPSFSPTFLYTLPHNQNTVLHKRTDTHSLNGTRLTPSTLTLTFRTKTMVYTSCTVLTMSFSWNLNNTSTLVDQLQALRFFRQSAGPAMRRSTVPNTQQMVITRTQPITPTALSRRIHALI